MRLKMRAQRTMRQPGQPVCVSAPRFAPRAAPNGAGRNPRGCLGVRVPHVSPLSPPPHLQVLGNATAARYVAGIGVHWYLDSVVPARCSLAATHRLFPHHLLLYTEACSGFLTLRFPVSLGCWERGVSYSHSILSVRTPPPPPPRTRTALRPLPPPRP